MYLIPNFFFKTLTIDPVCQSEEQEGGTKRKVCVLMFPTGAHVPDIL